MLLNGFLWPLFLCAQQTDTLPAVKVVAQEVTDVSKTGTAVQHLGKKELSMLNSLSVADAVKYFSGVIIKDYGGIGGLKTISVRSLGANHTGVMYDGIMIGDAQGGQADLGRFSLDNIETIQLSVSNPENILLPARSYASASVLSLTSSTTRIQKRSLTLRVKGGSFGFFNPSFLIRSGIGEKFSHALSAEYQEAAGNYPYRNYVAGEADSKRLNSDIKTYRAEYDAGYAINDSNKLKLKLYYYNSERGLPGAVILYNNFSNERFDNEVFFSQLSWQKNISAGSRLLLNGKFSRDYKYYLDPSYQNSAGKLENRLHQQEVYFSGAYSYKISDVISAGYSADYFNSKLKRTDDFAQGFANPGRDNFLNNVAVVYEKNNLTANANILYTVLREKVQNGMSGRNLNEFSPAASFSYHLSKQSPVRIRAFYKRIFRAPSFDDLYYTNVGNTDLKPEFVDQYNIGATFSRQSLSPNTSVVVTADAYYNKVKDKILAVPRQNLFQWTMLNIGKVNIKGLDATLLLRWKKGDDFSLSPRLSYSFQQARDMSDPSSALYKKQIPYTPMHSGAAGFNVLYKNFTAAYNALFSSYRYRLGDQVNENLVKEWATQDISLGYIFKSKKNNEYRLTGELNNIFNKQYEIIKYYPMPRFNYRIGIIAVFNQS
jgi:outer membrane cobalamin receptor